MWSVALGHWLKVRHLALDEFEAAHKSVGGTGRGRRYATLQINHAYTVILSSQVQGFCRDLHSEAAAFLQANTNPRLVAQVLARLLVQGRKLDTGNPNPGNLGSDFGLLGMAFWDDVRAVDGRNRSRQDKLDEMTTWRNAIAHQDWSKVGGDPNLTLAKVRGWRSACGALAKSFDRAVGAHLATLVGHAPW